MEVMVDMEEAMVHITIIPMDMAQDQDHRQEVDMAQQDVNHEDNHPI